MSAVIDENFEGVPFDLRRFAFKVVAVAVPIFIVTVSNPWNVDAAWVVSYVEAAISALGCAFGFCAAYRSWKAVASGARPAAPGEWLLFGMAANWAVHIAADLAYAAWLHSGNGFYSHGTFQLGWSFAACAVAAAPTLFAVAKKLVDPPWSYALLAHGILNAFFAVAGLFFAVLWALEVAGSSSDFQIAAVGIGYALVALIGGIGALCWFAYCCGLYARDYSRGEPYPWMHYAPVAVWGMSIASRIVAIVGDSFANSL